MICMSCGQPSGSFAYCERCRGGAEVRHSANVSRSPATHSSTGLVPSGKFVRICASFLDGFFIILGLIIVLYIISHGNRQSLQIFTHALSSNQRTHASAFSSQDALVNFISFTFVGIFYVFFEVSPLRATPGKLLFGLAVCNLQGGRLSLARAIVRYLGRFLGLPIFLFGIFFSLLIHSAALLFVFGLITAFMPFADLLSMFVTDDHRTLHDLIAGAVVLRR